MNIFQEQNGDYSMARFVLFICTIGAIGLSGMAIYMGRELIGTSTLVGALLGFPMGLKAVQKKEEQKND